MGSFCLIAATLLPHRLKKNADWRDGNNHLRGTEGIVGQRLDSNHSRYDNEVEGKGGEAPNFFSIGLPPFLLGNITQLTT